MSVSVVIVIVTSLAFLAHLLLVGLMANYFFARCNLLEVTIMEELAARLPDRCSTASAQAAENRTEGKIFLKPLFQWFTGVSADRGETAQAAAVPVPSAARDKKPRVSISRRLDETMERLDELSGDSIRKKPRSLFTASESVRASASNYEALATELNKRCRRN